MNSIVKENLFIPGVLIYQQDINNKTPYLFLLTFTVSHIGYAQRLINSIIKFNLPFVALQIPNIHSSVSPKGVNDINYTKANMIKKVIECTGRPVVYIDSDCEIKSKPYIFEYIYASGFDFSIFNWLNIEDNQAFKTLKKLDSVTYTYSHSIDFVSRTQLICSGAVQYWSNSELSMQLLENWMSIVYTNPFCADDQILDYAYNNFKNIDQFKRYWLPKSYARYAWWVNDIPVIDHPDYPNPGIGFKDFSTYKDLPRIHLDQLVPRILTNEEIHLRINEFKIESNGVKVIINAK